MKLPTLMRKATSSSTNTGRGTSNGPTPSDEAKGSTSPDAAAAAIGGSGFFGAASSSPRNSAGSASASASANAAPAKSIGSSFAGFSNLLSRTATGTTPNEAPITTGAAATSSTSPQSENVGVGSPSADEVGAGSAFKGFGWFKRASVLSGPGTPSAAAASAQSEPVMEEKVLSPPFRSLDHDQLSISRQSVISPLSESQVKQLANGATPAPSNGPSSSTSTSSIRTPSVSGSNNNALALAARFGDEEEAKKAAEEFQNAEPELSHRAQRAAQKTEQVEHLTDVLPSFD